MPTVYVDVSAEILQWLFEQVSKDPKDEENITKIASWINGNKKPTFRQVEQLSKKYNIPLGYFFLQTPPNEKAELLEFRTIDSIGLTDPSRNLLDVYHEMKDIQEWMKTYRIEHGFDKISVVDSLNLELSINDILRRMRHDLGIERYWYKNCTNSRDAFNYFRTKLENTGIIVMLSGIVGNNTRRTLDITEFRAFAIIDDWAPLIFINNVDSAGAKLFSLLHEAVHIWLGESDLFNDRDYNTNVARKTETICNMTAAELIVPKFDFIKKWNASLKKSEDRIKEIAKIFHCSDIVAARRALDNNKISDAEYTKIVNNAIEQYNQRKRNGDGGNYYSTMASRLDKNFVGALCEGINERKVTYTEAYRLTNTNRKTFDRVIETMGV